MHKMEAAHQQTGHLILLCPICGYSVQIDERTGEKKTLNNGDKMTVPHTWAIDGGTLGIAGSKEKPA